MFEFEKICNQLAILDAEQQTAFFDMLRGTLDEREITALQIGTAYFHIFGNEKLRETIKAALAADLYKHFTGGTAE